MIKLKPLFDQMALAYPTLFGTDDRAWRRAELSTMLTVGNGYEWKDGEFVNRFEDYAYPKTLIDELDKTIIREVNDRCPQIKADHLRFNTGEIKNTPTDVTDEWLEVVEDVLEYIFNASAWHFSFTRGGQNGVEYTTLYNSSAECSVKNHFWNIYQELVIRIPRIKKLEKPTNSYNPFDTKKERDEQTEIVKEIMNEIWQEEAGEKRYE